MQDKRVSVSIWPIVTAFTWVLVVAFISTAAVTERSIFAWVGLATSAVAATLSMGCFVCSLNRNIQTAFDLGRDVGRSEVSRIR